jgi:hypothetical protein
MPDDETALHYFDMYFMNVHPYVPVLNKALFYQQWHTNRDAISPLILEAIFAIAGRLADEPAQGHQWLALASSESIEGKVGLEANMFDRTCRFFYGRAAAEHSSSDAHRSEGPRVSTKARLLFSILDDGCSVRANGKRSWIG